MYKGGSDQAHSHECGCGSEVVASHLVDTPHNSCKRPLTNVCLKTVRVCDDFGGVVQKQLLGTLQGLHVLSFIVVGVDLLVPCSKAFAHPGLLSLQQDGDTARHCENAQCIAGLQVGSIRVGAASQRFRNSWWAFRLHSTAYPLAAFVSDFQDNGRNFDFALRSSPFVNLQ